MSRLLSLLIMLAFVLTNSAAIAAAVCRHDNLEAHAAARQSGDARVAATAIIEEAAAAAESKQGALADAAGAQLAGFILPPDPALPAPSPHSIAHGPAVDAAKHRSRTVGPLLEPPLA